MTVSDEAPGEVLRTDNNNSSAAEQYKDEDHHEDGFASFMGFMTSPVVQPDNVSASNENNESGDIERGIEEGQPSPPIPTNDDNNAPMPPAALQDSNGSTGDGEAIGIQYDDEHGPPQFIIAEYDEDEDAIAKQSVKEGMRMSQRIAAAPAALQDSHGSAGDGEAIDIQYDDEHGPTQFSIAEYDEDEDAIAKQSVKEGMSLRIAAATVNTMIEENNQRPAEQQPTDDIGSFHDNVPTIEDMERDERQAGIINNRRTWGNIGISNDEGEGRIGTTATDADEVEEIIVPRDDTTRGNNNSVIILEDMLDNLQRLREENNGDLPPFIHRTLSQVLVDDDSTIESNERRSYFGWRGRGSGRRASMLFSPFRLPNSSSDTRLGSSLTNLVQATLVEDEEVGEVYEAEPVSEVEQNWKKIFGVGVCVLLSVLAVIISLSLTGVIGGGDSNVDLTVYEPTPHDTRPTLQIIRERGKLRCGMYHGFSADFHIDMCRALASVIVGHSEAFELVYTTWSTRWQDLTDRNLDVLAGGDTYSLERAVRESSTELSFTFSNPFLYDGMVYVGQPTFVKCAEEGRRFGECTELKICVVSSTTWQDNIKDLFPSIYIEVASTQEELISFLDLGICNVAGYEGPMKQYLAGIGYVVGEKMMTKEPNAFVTRSDDREFSDAVNWVLQALIWGEEQGLTKDLTLCQNSSDLNSYQVSDLDFMNAVHCVGNYGEIMGAQRTDGGKNHINRGKSGMMYALPFGKIDREYNLGDLQEGTLKSIRHDGHLKCGVLAPPGFKPNLAENKGLMGMGIDYCHALASALFFGDSDSVDIFTFPNFGNSSYIALANGTVDVIAGGKVQKKFDFRSTESLEGFHFSTPYYYGDTESDVGVYSMVTRQDDLLLSSFVDVIVLGSIYAQENGIKRDDRLKMPQMTLFGNELTWALRDLVEYAGNYDEIYKKNFESNLTDETRGRNAVNQGGPLMLSRSGLPGD